jgi:CDP-glucose 4,6-dehydratase
LLDYGAKVVGLDIKTHRKETILKSCPGRLKIVKGSVEDYPLLLKVLKGQKIEFVFHLAAAALVGESLLEPLTAFSTNIKGTWCLLEACRQNKKVKGIVVASSDKAYGAKNVLPYRESASLNGDHPYDASKSCADILAYTYYNTYRLPVCVTRCGNIYGPGDFNFSRIIPEAVRSVIANRPLNIRSDGKFTRDYVYVKDIVSGYLALARNMGKSGLSGEAFNFSDESPITVISLVNKIFKIMGSDPGYKILNCARYEIKHQYLCAAKARKVLGWKPRFSLEEGLEETIAWYSAYLQKEY